MIYLFNLLPFYDVLFGVMGYLNNDKYEFILRKKDTLYLFKALRKKTDN